MTDPNQRDPRAAGGGADLWGQRVLLSNIPALINGPPFAKMRATVIELPDCGRPRAIDVQMRFALNSTAAANNPLLPFSATWPSSPPQAALRVSLRRGLDPQASVSLESKLIERFPQQFPWDILVQRNLGVDVDLVGGTPTSVWIETVATPVNLPAFRDQIKGWNRALTGAGGTNFFAAVASPAQVTLLEKNEARVQFFIVNTSTNADMIIDLGLGTGGASWAGPTGSIVLPRNNFNTYESPIGGYSGGPITATWTAAPNGGALVTEGVYGL
jgi:hypothetical protein